MAGKRCTFSCRWWMSSFSFFSYSLKIFFPFFMTPRHATFEIHKSHQWERMCMAKAHYCDIYFDTIPKRTPKLHQLEHNNVTRNIFRVNFLLFQLGWSIVICWEREKFEFSVAIATHTRVELLWGGIKSMIFQPWFFFLCFIWISRDAMLDTNNVK